MMRILSPHLDDAVLSLGQFMSTVPCEVITVFAGTPEWGPRAASAYDRARGFTTSAEAMAMRRSEDAAAVGGLRGRVRHLEFLDGQYLDGDRRTDSERETVTDVVADLIDPTEHFFAPLGIGHPDHRFVAQCARDACPAGGGLCLYEELPYRVLHPEEVFAQLDVVRAEGFEVGAETWPPPLGAGDRMRKAKVIGAYRSQFPNGADDPCLLVPERIWRCTR